MPRDSFLVFGAPLIEEPEIREVAECLRSGWIGTGPRVARFEERFREYVGAREAVAVYSCTAALHLAMEALGIGEGAEVIVPTMTFAATCNAVIHAGGRPVLVDVQRETQNIDPQAIAAAITDRTRAVVIVHFAGRPCEMEAVTALCHDHGLALIEDCAHAIESEYRGRKTGTFGDAGCFSFYVTKNLVTGEGGMLVTQREEIADRARTLALHGTSSDAWRRFRDKGFVHYDVVAAGYKYNMMDIQAALGLHQLDRIARNWRRRARIWQRYQEELRALPVALPAPAAPQTRHAYHLFTLLLDLEQLSTTRDDFLARMTEQNIGVGVHYRALHLHPYYRERYGYRRGDFPNAEWISERTASIPISPALTDRDVDDVVKAVHRALDL